MSHGAIICIRNEGCEDLELGKAYQVLTDESAAKDDYIRVVDESGEDYLHPICYFASVDPPQEGQHERSRIHRGHRAR